MNQIEAVLTRLEQKKEKAFIPYLTAGLPDKEGSKAIIRAIANAGIDILELGVPFSDPAADGPVIQDASYRSILKGTNLAGVFDTVAELRNEGLELPIVFMLYYNTAYHYGLEAFAETCRKTGVDGVIIPDLPIEEQEELKRYLDQDRSFGEASPILIQLVSPASGERIPEILKDARGFVYCVSSMGVTGQGGAFHREIIHYLEEVKSKTKLPVMMGFGIRTPEDVEPMKRCIDGVIVGSYFLQLLAKYGYDPEKAAEYCRSFKQDLNGGTLNAQTHF